MAKKDFNKASGKSPKTKNKSLSEKALFKKIDLYGAVAKKGIDKARMKKLKDDTIRGKQEAERKRVVQRINLQQGIHTGFQPQNAVEKLENNYESIDRTERGKVAEQAKKLYHRHYSLTRQHRIVSRNKTKGKGMTK